MRHDSSRLGAAVAKGTEVQNRNCAISRAQLVFPGRRDTVVARDGSFQQTFNAPGDTRAAVTVLGPLSSIGEQTHTVDYTQGDCSR
jgi:hypothetical protein